MVSDIQSFSITVTVVDKFFLNSGVYIEEIALYQVPEKHQSGGKQNMKKKMHLLSMCDQPLGKGQFQFLLTCCLQHEQNHI